MALDGGGVTHLQPGDPEGGVEAPAAPTVHDGTHIGAALKAGREHRGLTLNEVADATRIRRAYVAAMEELRIEELPSRPFLIGYIRAYADLVGFPPEAAIARFKSDEPDADDALRAPVGVRPEKDPRLGVVIVVGVLIIAAIVLWNVAQRAITAETPSSQTVEATEVAPNVGPAQVSLGAPLPAPVESTTPTPYVTPGLADSVAGGGSADAASAAAKARAAELAAQGAAPPVNLGAPFKAEGQVYGATQGASTVIVQARKSGALVARGADGAVFFARQMAAGEAYRAPAVANLQIDVSDPAVFEVYVNGALTGHPPAALTPLSKLVGAPPKTETPQAL